MSPLFNCQWYQEIFEKFPKIVADAQREGRRLGLDRVAGRFGLYTGASSLPGALPDYVLDAVVAANREPILPVKRVEDDIRVLVKEIYGDACDCAVTNTCEAALRVSYETLFAPPFMRRGDAYRSRVLTPYGEDYEWGAAYGRPFPPRYKNIAVDRSVSAGELGIPTFTLEDLYANTNPILLATEAMGVEPATIYNCNMLLTPGLGTLRADGELDVERATLAAKALVKSVEIVCEHAGLGD